MTDTSDTAIEAILPALIARDMAHEAAMLIALQAERKAGWAAMVRPLEWVKDTMPNAAPQRYRAVTHDRTGDYSVSGSKNSDAWQWFRNGYFVDGHQHHKPKPIATAKAAAQADYTARILAALEPVTAPDPAAIREAALHVENAKRLRRYDWQEWTAQDIEDAEGIICAILALIPKGAADDRA